MLEQRTIVVSALISNSDSRVLMALRPPHKALPDMWEIPGGKVEKGELEREALMREVREELGIQVRVGRLISTASFTWDARVHMLLYECLALTRPMRPLASDGLAWLDPTDAARNLPCCPSLFSWMPDIVEHLESGDAYPSEWKHTEFGVIR